MIFYMINVYSQSTDRHNQEKSRDINGLDLMKCKILIN